MDDVASGVRPYLIANFPTLISLLGSVPNTDPNPSNHGQPFIFRENLMFTLKGTGQSALVLTNAGGWGSSLELGSLRFSRLQVDIYTDSARDAGYNATQNPGGTVKRLEQVFSYLQSALHRVDPAAVIWGDLVTIGCTLLAEGQTHTAPDGDWMQMKTAFYGVRHTGWTDLAVV